VTGPIAAGMIPDATKYEIWTLMNAKTQTLMDRNLLSTLVWHFWYVGSNATKIEVVCSFALKLRIKLGT